MSNRLQTARTVALLTAVCLAVPSASAAALDTSAIELRDITFVSSRAGEREMWLRSRSASLDPRARTAELSDVSAELADSDDAQRFSVRCERAVLELDTRNFRAEGRVRGETGDGQRYATDWVRYDHEAGVLFSDAPVQVSDARGSLRGDGFRYHVRERRFELIGNVRVEQGP